MAAATPPEVASDTLPATPPARRSRAKLWLVLAICLAPVLASYYEYYAVRPASRINYGDLVEPQRPMPALALSTLEGRPYDAAPLAGHWLMVMVAPSQCPKSCVDKLYHLRQVRLTTGKERERVVRVWLIPDDGPVAEPLLRAYEGTEMIRARQGELEAWLPATDATSITDHIYIVDPHANLMMRFPKDADPNRTKKDLARLLAASSIG